MVSSARLIGIDVGTTHCKAGLFAADGAALSIARRPTPTRRAPEGHTYYDPEELWQAVASALSEVAARQGQRVKAVVAVGVASMGEAGLLVDSVTGAPMSDFVPWYDPCATPQGELLRSAGDPLERFRVTGWRAGFKCSLAKILWLRERRGDLPAGARWLSVAGYVTYRLTGAMAVDYSLANRTFAFDLARKEWDAAWLRSLGLDPAIFPTPGPSGAPVGRTTGTLAGIPAGTPVAVSGHDHICASLAAGVTGPGRIFDSMGTAEAILGVTPDRPLGEAEFRSGFAFGCHAVPGMQYWLGGLSASGGSVEWLRGVLGGRPLSYRQVKALLGRAGKAPTGILYFPYLAGRGSPHSDGAQRGAFVGLRASHGRADLLKAVLEGTAYEVESILRAARTATGEEAGEQEIVVAGGGARLERWLQIKADVSGCRLSAPGLPEATLLGAALTAGVGAAVWSSHRQALDGLRHTGGRLVEPEPSRHETYRLLYEQGFEPVGRSLGEYYRRERT
jgi:sugar (pentulose or hexulose) kinase